MKAVFLDIDGTFVTAGTNTPPESALAAVRAARTNGHKVFLCTGRSYDMAAPVLAYGFDGAICSAGGYIVSGEEVLYDRPLSADELQAVRDAMNDPDIFCVLEAKDRTFVDLGADALKKSSDPKNSELLRWQSVIEQGFRVYPLRGYDGRPVYKVSFLSLRRDALERPKQLLEDRYQFCLQDFFSGDAANGELIPRAFDKGQGVRRVCDFLRVPLADSVGFGDSMNDLDMIRTVGTGVCMGNGSETLKRHSDIVCPAVDRDGLAYAFHALHLI